MNELTSILINSQDVTPTERIVRALSERGAMSAAQIARVTGLAKSTVSTSLLDMRRSELVVEAEVMPREAGVGRPATLLTLNPKAGTCVGVLFGLREIRVIVADVSHAVISDEQVTMDDDYSPQDAIEIVRRSVRTAHTDHALPTSTLLGVGIAVAGPVNPLDGKVMRASVLPTWAGLDLRAVFEPALQRPIFADNESNCSALAEMMWGAAIGYDDFMLFKVDRGVGGAIVSGGRVLTGIAGGAGEFGHMTVDPNGPLCRCGNRGCLELYASFLQPLEYASRRFGRKLSMDDVIALARAGDVGCRRLIEDTAEMAGRGLGMIGAILNPGLIIIGGRMALADEMLLEPLTAAYEKHTLVKRADVVGPARTEIIRGKLTENDACMGAVGLVLRHHGRLS